MYFASNLISTCTVIFIVSRFSLAAGKVRYATERHQKNPTAFCAWCEKHSVLVRGLRARVGHTAHGARSSVGPDDRRSPSYGQYRMPLLHIDADAPPADRAGHRLRRRPLSCDCRKPELPRLFGENHDAARPSRRTACACRAPRAVGPATRPGVRAIASAIESTAT